MGYKDFEENFIHDLLNSISETSLEIGEEEYDLPAIKKVIFQGTHTVVIWEDDEKTIVNCFDEAFDQEKGLAMAILKRFISRADFNRLIENATVKE